MIPPSAATATAARSNRYRKPLSASPLEPRNFAVPSSLFQDKTWGEQETSAALTLLYINPPLDRKQQQLAEAASSIAPRQRLNSEAKIRQLERELHHAHAATAGVTLPTFCREWDAVFANPNVIRRPSAVAPKDPPGAEDRYVARQGRPSGPLSKPTSTAPFGELSARIKAAKRRQAKPVFPAKIKYKGPGPRVCPQLQNPPRGPHHSLRRPSNSRAGEPDIGQNERGA